MTAVVPSWVIYDRGAYGYLGFHARAWLMRPWQDDERTESVLVAHDLEQLRDALADMSLFCIGRGPDEPTNVIETWV